MTQGQRFSYEMKYRTLLQLSHKIRDTMNRDEILNHLLDTLQTILAYDAAGIFVLSRGALSGKPQPPKQLIAGIARRGFDSRPVEDDEMLTEGKGIIGNVIRSGESLVVPDVRRDPRYVVGRSTTRSEIAVPIIYLEQTIGALNLESDQLGTYDEEDLEVLHFFADAAAISIEKAMLYAQILEKQQLEEQLRTATQIQSHLLPLSEPDVPGYSFAGICTPSQEIGGDYYDYIPLSYGRLGIVVGDVSGKGIPAALIMSVVRALVRTYAQSDCDPVCVASTLNRSLPGFTRKSDFVTILYGVLEPGSGRFTYVRCGHPSPLLIHDNGRYEELEAGGPLLGSFTDAEYVSGEVTLKPGDFLMIYTDGVIECMDEQELQFGIERLADAVRLTPDLSPSRMVEGIIKATQAFSADSYKQDDSTLVLIKRL